MIRLECWRVPVAAATRTSTLSRVPQLGPAPHIPRVGPVDPFEDQSLHADVRCGVGPATTTQPASPMPVAFLRSRCQVLLTVLSARLCPGRRWAPLGVV
jgi:hypothetical protein